MAYEPVPWALVVRVSNSFGDADASSTMAAVSERATADLAHEAPPRPQLGDVYFIHPEPRYAYDDGLRDDAPNCMNFFRRDCRERWEKQNADKPDSPRPYLLMRLAGGAVNVDVVESRTADPRRARGWKPRQNASLLHVPKESRAALPRESFLLFDRTRYHPDFSVAGLEYRGRDGYRSHWKGSLIRSDEHQQPRDASHEHLEPKWVEAVLTALKAGNEHARAVGTWDDLHRSLGGDDDHA